MIDKSVHPTLAMLAEEVKRHRITLIGGSIPEISDNKVFNTSPILSWKSDTIVKHRKLHLFDVNVPGGICFQESETLTAGDHFTVYPYSSSSADFLIGVGICYDVRFPELALVYAQRGCKLLAYPSAFNISTTRARRSPWITISPSLAEPPTPHLFFRIRASSFKSSWLPTKPFTNVTVLPPRPARSSQGSHSHEGSEAIRFVWIEYHAVVYCPSCYSFLLLFSPWGRVCVWIFTGEVFRVCYRLFHSRQKSCGGF